MTQPKVSRPQFPHGYVEQPVAFVTWEYVTQRLSASKNYWLTSVRPASTGVPGGRPHVIPRWGAFVDGRLYYDGSPETRHARNLALNPNMTVNLESGDEVVILEGTSAAMGKPAPALAQKIAQAYRLKYGDLGYAPAADQWDEGGLYEFTPRLCLAWTKFTEDPTKFVFE
jgi:hypothetical protein